MTEPANSALASEKAGQGHACTVMAVPLLEPWGCPQISPPTGVFRANAGVWPEGLGENGGTRSDGLAQGGPEGSV